MRLMRDDFVRLEIDAVIRTMRIVAVSGNGQIFMTDAMEANVDARNRDKADTFAYGSKMAGSLKKSKSRRVTISPIGELRDGGFIE